MQLLNLWVVFAGFGAFHGYFLAGVFFFQCKGHRRANQCLALLLLVLSLILTEFLLSILGLYTRWPHLIFSTAALWYVVGPLFYCYLRLVLWESFAESWKEAWHFMPFIVVFGSIVLPFYLLPGEVKLAAVQSGQRSAKEIVFNYGVFVQLLAYVMASARIVRRFEASCKHEASGIRVFPLQWITLLLGLLAAYVFVAFAASVLPMTLGVSINGMAPLIILSFLIHVVGYTAIRQPEKLFPVREHAATPDEGKLTEEKYQTSSLMPGEAKQGLEKLRRLMETEQPFLNSDLKLADLAAYLDMPPHHLSQIINQELGENFYEFVNQYRIDEAKKRLVDPANAHMTILAIALDAGFNNKSSFNRVFKKSTGMSPSAYIAQVTTVLSLNGTE